ncbi:MAG: hypothetical protein ACTHU0_21770 [Kofleriaceae bacterium]
MEITKLDEFVFKAKRAVCHAEERLQCAKAARATVLMVREKYPDAEPFGHWSSADPAIPILWASTSVRGSKVDIQRLVWGWNGGRSPGGSAVSHVLYDEFIYDGEVVRIYSPDEVDVLRAFANFNAGRQDLVAAMRTSAKRATNSPVA